MTSAIQSKIFYHEHNNNLISEQDLIKISKILDMTEISYYKAIINLDYLYCNSIILEFYDDRKIDIEPVIKVDFRAWTANYLVYFYNSIPVKKNDFSALWYAIENINDVIADSTWALQKKGELSNADKQEKI